MEKKQKHTHTLRYCVCSSHEEATYCSIRRFDSCRNETCTQYQVRRVCARVFFTWNRSFFPSTWSTPSVRADSSSYVERCKLCAHKTTTQQILHCNAVSGVANTMMTKREELRRQRNKENKQINKPNKWKMRCRALSGDVTEQNKPNITTNYPANNSTRHRSIPRSLPLQDEFRRNTRSHRWRFSFYVTADVFQHL